MPRHRKKRPLKRALQLLSLLLLCLIAVGLYHIYKPLPAGIDYDGPWRQVSADSVRFLYDLSYEKEGSRVHEQQIFDRIFSHIDAAEEYILLDMFLFNGYLGNADDAYRQLSSELAGHLVAARKRHPDIRIDVITDPINTVYGGSASPVVAALEAGGINVVVTDLTRLRDSNPLYSALWRTFVRWWGNSPGGRLPHPFSTEAPTVSLRSYLALVNFKANHRKVFTADAGEAAVSMVISANPHDASAAHSNVALEVRGGIARDLFNTEQAVADFSGGRLTATGAAAPDETGDLRIRVVSEAAIHRAVVGAIDTAGAGERIDIAMFYLSDRDVVAALKGAAHRGVAVRLVLDPNKDAFGYEKSGVPNRPVAHELVAGSEEKIRVRWYDTKGEQFHSKMVLVEGAERSTVILGSANLTRRNLENYNLELDVMLTGESAAPVFSDIRDYFDRIWNNRDGVYTADYGEYQDDSFFKKVSYNIQERFGLSSF